ncbi:MAG: DNA repair protein RecO [Dehalococcoidia bacterium]|nr:DNA repair protein RecO [Dehalococcoidia bacterium]
MSPSKPEINTSTGIVIKINDLGEADRIITLITPNFGLIRGVAKSARKTVSKLGGHFDILKYVNFSIREAKSISQLSQATTIYGYKKIRTDLNLFFQTSYISEIAEKFSIENNANLTLFNLLKKTLDYIEEFGFTENLLHFYELKILETNGFAPELYKCVESENILEPGNHYYCPERGGLIDFKYSNLKGNLTLLPANLNTIKYMRYLSKSSMEKINNLSIDEIYEKQASRILKIQIKNIVDRNLKSEKFITKKL